MTSDTLTAQQVADLVGTSRRQVIRWASAGTLPVAQKLPGATGAYLFHRRDVERLAKERAA